MIQENPREWGVSRYQGGRSPRPTSAAARTRVSAQRSSDKAWADVRFEVQLGQGRGREWGKGWEGEDGVEVRTREANPSSRLHPPRQGNKACWRLLGAAAASESRHVCAVSRGQPAGTGTGTGRYRCLCMYRFPCLLPKPLPAPLFPVCAD